jgi:serine/threonine-protein kinase
MPQGGILVTPASLHLLSMTHGLGCIAQGTTSGHPAVAPDGSWFALACPGDRAFLEVVLHHLTTPPGQGVKISPPLRVNLPTEAGDELVTLLAVDVRHSVAVVRRGSRTLFHGVSRRGSYMGSLTTSVPLYNLVPTHRPYRYLALEEGCPSAVLVLDLLPFRMLRHRVDIAPRWLFETAVGYGLLSAEGEFALINEEGCILNQMTGLPRLQAMTPLQPQPDALPSQYLWSVSEGNSSRIYTVNLSNLAPDLLC